VCGGERIEHALEHVEQGVERNAALREPIAHRLALQELSRFLLSIVQSVIAPTLFY
jgi:hypothetical protein